MKAGNLLKIIVSVFLIWNALMYFTISIITWQFNPAYWEQAHRFAFAIIGIYIGLGMSMVVLIALANVEDLRDKGTSQND